MKTLSKKHFVKISLGACIAFFVLLALASKSDPEKTEKTKKDASGYYAVLGKIYNDVNTMMTEGPKQMELSQESARLLDASEQDIRPEITAVYLPLMKRFTVQDTTEWKNDYAPWEWLTIPLVHGIQNVNDPRVYYYSDVEYRIGKIKEATVLAIIAPSPNASNVMPSLSEDKTNFTSGKFSGWLFLANATDGAIVAAYPLEVQSSEIVKFRSGGTGIAHLFDTNPVEAIKVDFQDNFSNAVNAPLNGWRHITLQGGSLF